MPSLLSDNDVRILREVVAWVKSARGPGVTNTPGGLFIGGRVANTPATRSQQISFATITSSAATGVNDAAGNPVQWTYQIQEAFKHLTGYQSSAWASLTSGYSGTAYHLAEFGNLGTGRQMNGVDHGGADYPAGFEMRPLQDGAVVPFVMFGMMSEGSSATVEAWILPMMNGEDGTCV